LHRLGDCIVNVYLVEESAQVTIIDAGVPSYWNELPAALERWAARWPTSEPCC